MTDTDNDAAVDTGQSVDASRAVGRDDVSESRSRGESESHRWSRRLVSRVYAAFRHPRLRAKLMVGVIAGAVLATGAQFYTSYQGTMGNLRRLEAERMNENLQVALNVLEHYKLDLQTLAVDYASPEVTRKLRQGDRRWLHANVVERIGDLHGAGLVVVARWTPTGVRVVTASGDYPESLLDEEAVRDNENGVPSTQFASWDGRIWLLAAAPIGAGETGARPVGTLIIARPVDGAFAATVKRSTNSDIAFILEGRTVATTNTDLEPVVAQAETEKFQHEGGKVAVAQGYAAVSELLAVPGAPSRIVVALSRDPITSAQRTLLRDSAIAACLALAIAVLIAIILSRQLSRPIVQLTAAAQDLAAAASEQRLAGPRPVDETGGGEVGADRESLGQERVPVSASRRDEVGDLGRAFNVMVEKVDEAQATLLRAAVRDGLTGLLNHGEFVRRLTEELARADRDGNPVSMLMIDLDLFKRVNDTYGHLVGDALLREIADMIVSKVRHPDIVARYAGDEFAVILPNADSEQAAMIGERVRSGTGEVPTRVGLPAGETVTISVGVVTRHPKQWSANRTVELADKALYVAKNAGRDRVEVEGAID